MAAKSIAMKQIKQAIQLLKDGINISQIAERLGIDRKTVRKYIKRVPEHDPQEKVPDKELAVHLYQTDHKVFKDEREKKLIEHFEQVVSQLKDTGVNKMLLHEEYLKEVPDGYKYSQYCFHFNNFIKRKDVVMHIDHAPGDQMMVDFAGKKPSYVHPDTGEVIYPEAFIAVFPHTGITFCYAVHSQKIPDFIECCVEAMQYFQGVPKTILCDNLRTAVKRTCKVEPTFTDACYQLSHHYNTTFSATRPYSPRDKAMVERCVNLVYSNVYARLRGRTFTSLAELNKAIREKIDEMNNRLYKGSDFSRRQLFEQNERPVLKPLPIHPFLLKNVSQATVQSNYHIELRSIKEYFSVPYIYCGKRVNVLWDNHSVEIYLDHHRIALHHRTNRLIGRYNTEAEHMPPNHLAIKEAKGLTEDQLISRARKVGRYTVQAITKIMKDKTYPPQAFKSCNAILLLQKQYDKERLELACAHALIGTRVDWATIKSILKTGKDKEPLLFNPEPENKQPGHDNIRGADHYR